VLETELTDEHRQSLRAVKSAGDNLLGVINDLLEHEFQANTWMAFWETAVAGRPAADVGADLGMTPGTVYVAKCRIRARLRDEAPPRTRRGDAGVWPRGRRSRPQEVARRNRAVTSWRGRVWRPSLAKLGGTPFVRPELACAARRARAHTPGLVRSAVASAPSEPSRGSPLGRRPGRVLGRPNPPSAILVPDRAIACAHPPRDLSRRLHGRSPPGRPREPRCSGGWPRGRPPGPGRWQRQRHRDGPSRGCGSRTDRHREGRAARRCRGADTS